MGILSNHTPCMGPVRFAPMHSEHANMLTSYHCNTKASASTAGKGCSQDTPGLCQKLHASLPPSFTITIICGVSHVISYTKAWLWGAYAKGLSTHEGGGGGHATPHMPVESAKCWWLLKIEPTAWAGGKGSCAVCVDLQAVGALEFFGELYSLAKGFGSFLRGVWAGFREREGSIFSNHQHFAVSTGICGVACPLPASRSISPCLCLVLQKHWYGN